MLKSVSPRQRLVALAFSPDGRLLAASGYSDIVDICRTDGSLSGSLRGHKDDVIALAFSPDGKLLASGDYSGYLRLWGVEDFKLIRSIRGHRRSITSLKFSPDGTTLASVSYDDTLKLWSTSYLGMRRNISSGAFLRGEGDEGSSAASEPSSQRKLPRLRAFEP